MLIAVVPAGGISQSTGAPVAAGSTATLYRLDPGGAIASMGPVTLYNLSTTEAVPAGAMSVVVASENGHYYCQAWAGQANAANVIHATGSPFHKGF